jgi:HlyD family secretion protein
LETSSAILRDYRSERHPMATRGSEGLRDGAGARTSAFVKTRLVRWIVGGAVVSTVAAFLVLRQLGPEEPVVTVTRGPVVQTLVVSGRVLAQAEIELGASVVARVESVQVDVGDRVEEGELLVSLDAAESEAAVQEAEAAERRAAAGLRQVRRVSGPIAEDTLESARVRLQDAEEDLARVRTLVQSGAMPRTRLDEAVRARDLARTELATASTRLASARAGGSESVLAAAQLAQAEAALVAARARLSQTRLLAPTSGVILHRRVDPGVVVSPGQSLLTLLADGRARLVVEPDESHLSLLAVGREALASADAFPDQRFDATVTWIAPAIDPERGTVEVRLEVPEPPDYLRADMTVSVEIEVGRTEDALVVPASVVKDGATDAPYVLVVEDGRVARRDVAIGLRGSSVLAIEDGLAEGDTVLAGDARDVSPGDRVRTVSATEVE